MYTCTSYEVWVPSEEHEATASAPGYSNLLIFAGKKGYFTILPGSSEPRRNVK